MLWLTPIATSSTSSSLRTEPSGRRRQDAPFVRRSLAILGGRFDGVAFFPPLEAAQPPRRRLVPRSLIVDRLAAAGKLAMARAALDAADLHTRERWNTRAAIYADDAAALALLQAIGADPDMILAPG